jgi:thiol-disulfide isomerase/thioredoxin
MKIKLPLVILTITGLILLAALSLQTTQRTAHSMDPELQAIFQNVQDKLKAGKNTEADLANCLADFDRLLAKHAGNKSETAAQILYIKAMLYLQVLNNPDQSKVFLTQLKTDYPETQPGKKAEHTLQMIEKQSEARKTQAALQPGAIFPDFNVKSLAGQPLSVGAFEGKVVLIDFWATWCGPCRNEQPYIIDAYEKHQTQGFEVIGVSLDSDGEKLNAFLKKHPRMAWPEFFDGQGWNNELAAKYGVQSIPFTVLIGKDGKIIKTDLRGETIEPAVVAALAR